MESRSTSEKTMPSREPAALMSSMDINPVAMISRFRIWGLSECGQTSWKNAPPPKKEELMSRPPPRRIENDGERFCFRVFVVLKREIVRKLGSGYALKRLSGSDFLFLFLFLF